MLVGPLADAHGGAVDTSGVGHILLVLFAPFVAGQLFQNFHLCSCMAKHINKIVNNNINIIIQIIMHAVHQLLRILVIGDLGI